MRQNPGNAKNTEYQTIKPKIEPRIGDTTIPRRIEASNIPRTLLCAPPLNKSPVKAIAIGAVPEAPIPWIALPIKTRIYAFKKNAAANPARRPPSPYNNKEGIIITFLKYRTKRKTTKGIRINADTEKKR